MLDKLREQLNQDATPKIYVANAHRTDGICELKVRPERLERMCGPDALRLAVTWH
jgi:hypothetical protein